MGFVGGMKKISVKIRKWFYRRMIASVAHVIMSVN